jgi:hypothetical protein
VRLNSEDERLRGVVGGRSRTVLVQPTTIDRKDSDARQAAVGFYDYDTNRSLVAVVDLGAQEVRAVEETPVQFQLSQEEKQEAEELVAGDERAREFLGDRDMNPLTRLFFPSYARRDDYVSYAADFAFTDLLQSLSGTAEVRDIFSGFDIRAAYDLYGGSYLYEHIWRFYEDGQFASSILIHGPGVENQGQHGYHVPFRYDLDLDGFAGDAFEQWFEGIGGWTDVPEEGRSVPAIYADNQSVQDADVVLWYIAHIPSVSQVTGCGPSFRLDGF